MKGIKIVPDDTKFDFVRWHVFALVFSTLVNIGAIGLTIFGGLNLGIDFTGGTAIEIRTPADPDLGAMRKAINELGFGEASIQEFGEKRDLLIRLPQLGDDAETQKKSLETVRATLDKQFDKPVDYRRTEFVGPQVGKELKLQGFYAVLFSIIGILAYVWVRFEWQFGAACIVALLHDCFAVLGLFAVTQMEFSLTTIAAILTIAGYSTNDTVVVFDRIRENLRKYKKMSLRDIINLSVNQTLSRTFVTGLTTLLALLALYIYGGEVIRGFVYALIFGIIVGTYSSVFVASPILLYLNLKRGDAPVKKDTEA